MFRIIFNKKAVNFFKKLDLEDKKIIGKKLDGLQVNPELGKPLTGKLVGLWSLRVGKFRIIYKLIRNELLILILDMGQRKNIYR